ncbi:MAG: sigma 54-interacting transcriptional regulator [Firmicutes bacterium]|nr:sigma 54-interacting transcriptional regulator [Bacillota bacterium]
MDSSKILVVLPDSETAAVVHEAANEMNQSLRVIVGVLEKGVEAAWDGKRSGFEVIISRGGTALLIQKSGPGLPVVEIPVTPYDIITSLYEARVYGRNIALVGFSNIVFGAKGIVGILEEVFGVRLTLTCAESSEDIESQASLLKTQGIEVMIGGILVVEAARRHGISGVILRSGKDAVITAIQEANRVARATRDAQHRANQLRTIIDFTYDGIIAVDRDGVITVFNPVAERIMGVKASKAIGKPVKDVVPTTRLTEVLKSGSAELGHLQKVGNTQILTNRVPIVVGSETVGVVATFQEIGKIQTDEQKIRRALAKRGYVSKYTFDDVVASTPIMRETIERARRFAQTDSTILLAGETGTGKELFAQSIHAASRRASQPFVAVSCAALPESLLESELFGYVEGAFTDARRGGKEGLFEIAHKGTLFLDEVGEMSDRLQARLLRVLQEKEVMRVGDDKIIPVDVRIIAATNRDLGRLVREGRFRADLFYRFNVLNIRIPPLRERVEDIPLLADSLMLRCSQRLGKSVSSITPHAVRALQLYDWPGNVREMENVIEGLCVLATGPVIHERDVVRILNTAPHGEPVQPGDDEQGVLKTLEASAIIKVLRDSGNNRKEAARRLGISTTTLWRRMKKLRLRTGD